MAAIVGKSPQTAPAAAQLCKPEAQGAGNLSGKPKSLAGALSEKDKPPFWIVPR